MGISSPAHRRRSCAAAALLSAALVLCPQLASARVVSFTWLGITGWLMETPAGDALLDAFVSRAPYTQTGTTPDGLALYRRFIAAARPRPIRWIFVGHSHFDHAIDAGTLALESGAQVIGSQTTCYMTQAQGLPPERCTVVGGGETLDLGLLEVKVARILHTAPATIGRYAVLTAPPTDLSQPTPTGGALGFRFRLRTRQGRTRSTWYWANTTGAPISADDGSHVDFVAALQDLFADGERPAVWFANSIVSVADLAPFLDIVRPQAFVPQHWDIAGLTASPLGGLAAPLHADDLAADLQTRGVDLVVPQQYFDKIVLRHGGTVRRLENARVKRTLGVPPSPGGS